VDVLQAVGTDKQSDKDFAEHILDELEVLGVDDFADSAVTIKIRIKTRPRKQWMVGRELRRRIKKAFNSKGIKIPFPHVSLYMGAVLNPFLTRPMTASEEVDLATKCEQQATAKQTCTRRRTSGARDASDTEGLGDVS
jgi:small conductance mechanosensitive channel